MTEKQPFRLVIAGNVNNLNLLPEEHQRAIASFCTQNGVEVEYNNDAEQAGKLRFAVTGDNLSSEQMQQAKEFSKKLSIQQSVNHLPGDNWSNISIEHDLKLQHQDMLTRAKEAVKAVKVTVQLALLPDEEEAKVLYLAGGSNNATLNSIIAALKTRNQINQSVEGQGR